MIKKETIVNGKKIKKIVEYYPSEEELESLKSRAVLTMFRHRLENVRNQVGKKDE